MAYNTLENYYKTVFSFIYHFKLPINVEEIMPFERDVYMAMIREDLNKKQEEAMKQQAIQQARQARGIF